MIDRLTWEAQHPCCPCWCQQLMFNALYTDVTRMKDNRDQTPHRMAAYRRGKTSRGQPSRTWQDDIAKNAGTTRNRKGLGRDNRMHWWGATSCRVCLLAGCLTSQQQASVSQGRIFSDNCTCCHTEIEVADQTFYLTQSQYTDTGPTSPSDDPITPGAWQGSHWSANF